MSYDSHGLDTCLGCKEFECFEAHEEAELDDVHPELVQLQDHFKYQYEELIECNLA